MPGRIYGFGRSDFETNLPNLVRSDAHGAPAADEARQGYKGRQRRVGVLAEVRGRPGLSRRPTDPLPPDCI